MRVYILVEQYHDHPVECIAAYTEKTSVDTHLKLSPNLQLLEAELDPPLPEHECVTRYEVWATTDFDNPTLQKTPLVVEPGVQRRGHVRTHAYCFWSYDSFEDAKLVMRELMERGEYSRRLDEMQLALYGRLV